MCWVSRSLALFSVFSSTRFLNTFFTRGEIKVHIGKTCATLPSFRLVSHAPAFSALPKLFPNCFLFIYLKTFAVKCCSFGFLLCCELFFPPFSNCATFFGIQFCFPNCLAFFPSSTKRLTNSIIMVMPIFHMSKLAKARWPKKIWVTCREK